MSEEQSAASSQQSESRNGRLLGVDYGTVRVGLAISGNLAHRIPPRFLFALGLGLVGTGLLLMHGVTPQSCSIPRSRASFWAKMRAALAPGEWSTPTTMAFIEPPPTDNRLRRALHHALPALSPAALRPPA